MALLEAHSRRGKLVHHGRFVTLSAVGGDAFVSEIVDENQHHVRFIEAMAGTPKRHLGPFQDRRLGLHKAAKFYYTTGWHESATVSELLINKAAWGKLPKDLQAIVENAAAACNVISEGWCQRHNSEAMEDLKKQGVIARPLPEDVVVSDRFADDAEARTVNVADVGPGDMILDIGPRTAARFAEIIKGAGTILWNGPVGVFEIPQFAGGTRAVANAVADSAGFSLAGGGDTLAALEVFGVQERISYVSTGGGAFLEYVEGRALPAVEVLRQRAAS
jgi:hypothetical protein